MPDNAPICNAYKVKDWLCDGGIELMEWPPNSPNPNPIEKL